MSNPPVLQLRVALTMTLCDRARNPRGCGLLQLREEVDADLLYRRYFYRSATSETMRIDLKDVIADITSRVALKAGVPLSVTTTLKL